MSTSAPRPYHHGNLRQALIDAAVDMLENGETFSLRGVARKAGVSQTAPYRHFPDRTHLESAIAAEGFRALRTELFDAHPFPTKPADIAEFAITYVRFALRRPHMFRLMFGKACDTVDDERVQAADELHHAVAQILSGVYPEKTEAELGALASAFWAISHGLAFLHLDGKLSPEPIEEVDQRVRECFGAVLAV